MSTHEERPTGVGGHADEDLFYPGTSGSDSSTYAFDPEGFSDSGATSVIQSSGGSGSFGPSDLTFPEERPAVRWHGGADFGLLVLRLVVGGTFVAHGLQHVVGLFNGPGINGYAKILVHLGYQHDTIMAWVGGIAELGGGGLLVLGLFTPVGAAAVLGVLGQLFLLDWHAGFFAPNGVELEAALAGGAFALLFTGPGQVALDRPAPWYRHPVLNGWIFLVVGAAVSAGVWFLMRCRCCGWRFGPPPTAPPTC